MPPPTRPVPNQPAIGNRTSSQQQTHQQQHGSTTGSDLLAFNPAAVTSPTLVSPGNDRFASGVAPSATAPVGAANGGAPQQRRRPPSSRQSELTHGSIDALHHDSDPQAETVIAPNTTSQTDSLPTPIVGRLPRPLPDPSNLPPSIPQQAAGSTADAPEKQQRLSISQRLASNTPPKLSLPAVPDLTITISPGPANPPGSTSASGHIYYAYDPATGTPIMDPNSLSASANAPPGMILVDRNPTFGPRNKPRHLMRKPSQRKLGGAPVSPGAATVGGVLPRPQHPQQPARTPTGRTNANTNSIISINDISDKAILPAGSTSYTSVSAPKSKEGGARWWVIMSRVLTFWAPTVILRRTIGDAAMQQAWREKVALCTIIAIIGAAVGFLTLGLTPTICSGTDNTSIPVSQLRAGGVSAGAFVVRGELYDLGKLPGPLHTNRRLFLSQSAATRASFNQLAGSDATALFPGSEVATYCSAVATTRFTHNCVSPDFPQVAYCHDTATWDQVKSSLKLGQVRYPWESVGGNLMVFNGRVLDLSPYFKADLRFLGDDLHTELLSLLGKDASYPLSRNTQLANAAACLQALYTVGFVDTDSPGCIASQIILSLSLILILGVVLTRFFLAVAFDWVLSWRLGKLQVSRAAFAQLHRPGRKRLTAFLGKDRNGSPPPISQQGSNPLNDLYGITATGLQLTQAPSQSDFTLPDASPIPDELRPYYTVVLVTCYSESEAELTKTLDSVSCTEFPDEQKLLFVVADGIITGKGQTKSTPETVLGLMDEILIGPTEPVSYVAIADGAKRHNKARVHVGWYKCGEHRTPMVVVIKSGNDDEQGKPKPGNRGKRDGQIILMDFFSKIMLAERLCPLQFDLFYKIFGLTGVHPLKYEIVLMVDADTKLLPDSLPRMVACMAQDSSIMGLCGETRIENKSQSWVTRIQVFEYYISHHLGKSFESIFGGVTCLPGCFCMYRLKVQRPDKLWVPILCSPVIITAYSENVVDTLHKKNLLSLGEDRYLSTLMLRNFPKRKMMFVPRALCRTIVPHTLEMLLSQRRRWINSTIHNLMELVLVRQLCGTFCFSMQFVVMMELFGTVSLPVAVTMTFYLIFQTILGNVQLIPLVMLVCILGLPAVLIMLTTRKFVYIYWMIIFLFSLPVWNFLLPVYAFWHFDDFSWGATRKVDGEHAQGDHSKREGEFDASKIPFLHIEDWTRLINGLPFMAEPLPDASAKPSDLPVTLYPAPDTTESGQNQGLGVGLDPDRRNTLGSAVGRGENGQRSSKLRRKTNATGNSGPQL